MIAVLFFRCCNTCEDVKEAYRLRRWALPDLSTIEQCKNDESIERTNLALKEGCQIYGYMEVNRVSIIEMQRYQTICCFYAGNCANVFVILKL